mgnify:CR=1 FL=1
MPTCGLGLAESERALPGMVERLEKLLAEVGLAGEEIIIRSTGCPNGCARSSSSEIGLIGKGVKQYVLTVGADYVGSRVNEILIPKVKEDEVVPRISQLLTLWKEQRAEGEGFGDWSHRVGIEKLRDLLGVVVVKKAAGDAEEE